MQEGQVAYRVRTATSEDATALRAAIGTTLAHPDAGARRESYRGAAAKGDILLLERFDRQEREWHVAAFVEFHLRVDDTLTIHDAGTPGDEPQPAALRYLLEELFASLKPSSALVKIRRDATAWLELFESIPGFFREGEEYRRPHYWSIWGWDATRAREARRPAQQPANTPRRPAAPPSRPLPPRGPFAGGPPRGAPGRNGPSGPPRPAGPRPSGGGSSRGPLPGGPGPRRPGGGPRRFGGQNPRGGPRPR